MKKPNIYWVDLFCGAGGTTTGIHLANVNAKVVVCVNHDAEAIKCHEKNHPDCLHLTEDIRDFKVILKIKEVVKKLRIEDPNCVINIWASLECTHFSKAKGGLARDSDSRTLAEHLYKYIEQLDPNYVYIENVREFLSWGPLDDKGKPVQKLKGVDYTRWSNFIKSYGYNYEYQILNSADFGAYTSRERYFGVFAKGDLPISFPIQTHSKRSRMKGRNLKPWKPVKEVLNLEDEGVSVFGLTRMGKKYSENTLKRVFSGLKKFSHKELLTTDPCFLTSYYGNGAAHSIDEPCNTLTTKERYAAHFINYDYSTPTSTSINSVAGTITTVPKHKLITTQWVVDTQFSNKGRSIEEPGPTLIARMDKKPLYMVSSVGNKNLNNSKQSYTDRPIERLMKYFMRRNNITDVKIRMLSVPELKTIQGFPDSFELTGTKTNQLKFIGNSVVPLMAQKLIESNYNSLLETAY